MNLVAIAPGYPENVTRRNEVSIKTRSRAMPNEREDLDPLEPETSPFQYPPEESDSRMTQHRFDSKERLIAWCMRQGDHYLLFRVKSFRDETLADGTTVEIPAAIICGFSERESDPMSLPEEDTQETFKLPENGLLYPDVDPKLQYNRARCYDERQGRWIAETALGWEPAEGDRFPYVGKPGETEGA
jgi:hypothetical protein